MTTKMVSEMYFEHLIWPFYIKYNQHLLNLNEILLLSGMVSDKQDVVKSSIDFVKNKIMTKDQDELRKLFENTLSSTNKE